MRRPLRSVLSVPVLLLLSAVIGSAQMAYFPYYGKNKINYERFSWKTYPTEHFKIFFYTDDPTLLKRVVETAESAYRKVSGDLKHHLADPVPLLYYTTVTDFEQSNVFPVTEGVLGVSEPILFRIGVHGDMPPDELQELIVHELTHVFEFDILWGNQGGALTAVSAPPDWTFEGLSEYTTARWSSWSILVVRDAVLNDRIPEFSESGELVSRYPLPRPPSYDFGHAAYEFIAQKYGPNAIRDFWRTLKSSSGIGRRDPFQTAFRLKSREFSQEYKKYLRARFKDFFTRENPEDYSVALGPSFPLNPYYFAFSHAVSPSGELVAALTYNAVDQDIDIVLLSAKDGSVLKNITSGYTTTYDYLKYDVDPSLGPSLAWSPDGGTLAFLARDGRRHSLFLLSSVTGRLLKKLVLSVDQPSGLCYLADGRRLLLAAFEKGQRDLFELDLQSGALRRLTRDDLFEKAPAVSPDGKSVVYSVRVGDEDKLFLSPLDDFSRKTQLTFGPGHTIGPVFSADGGTIYFSGDRREAYNIYSLELKTGEIRRFTDVRTGNFSPLPLPDEPGRLLFSSFNKGAIQLFKCDLAGRLEETVKPVDLPAAAALETFRPLLSFEIDAAKIRDYRGVGKLYVTSRPPVQAILSSDGSVYGGSYVSLSDVLGNHQFSVLAYQVRDYRSYAVSYLNQTGRLQFAASLFQYSIYYYPYYYYTSAMFLDRTTYNDAIAVRKITGASVQAYYPFSRYVRAEAGVGIYKYEEDVNDPYAASAYGMSLGFMNGSMAVASLSLTGETTQFRAYGPISGSTFRVGASQGLPVGRDSLRNTTVFGDYRRYLNLGSDILLAFRAEGLLCRGRDKLLSYYGGNNQVRSAYYYSLIATEYWFANLELRFPIIGQATTLIGTIGPVRGVLFFDVTRSKYGDYPALFYLSDENGYRAVEAIGSIGYGVQFFVFGLPIHLDWAKRLEWDAMDRPFKTASRGGYELKFWIGLDF